MGFFSLTAKAMRGGQGLESILKSLAILENTDVLVGIPMAKSSRSGQLNNAELGFILSNGVRLKAARKEIKRLMDSGQTFTSATEAYIHATGDMRWKIPPRPFLQPAIDANVGQIGKYHAAAFKAAMRGDEAEVLEILQELGQQAQNWVKGWFTNPKNGWAPNAPYTVAQKGSDKPNIDTGQLRNSITWVLRDKRMNK